MYIESIILLLLILLSYLGVKQYRQYALKNNILDYPNHRSSHEQPTPRGGGIVIAILWLLVLSGCEYFYEINLRQWLILFPSSLLVALIGFFDDRFHTPILVRTLFQVIAAIWVVYWLGGYGNIVLATIVLHWHLVGSIVVVVALLWSLNLFNFMDGTDGYAAMEAIFVFAVGGYLIYQQTPEAQYVAMLAWVIVALNIGFLILNWPKAKIFMGDVASGLLGFLIVAFALFAAKNFQTPLVLWIYLYGLFWFDATVTLIRRLFKGEKIYQAHKLHAYQRLHQAGFSHQQVLWLNIILNAIIAVIVVIADKYRQWIWWLGLLELVVLCGYYIWVEGKKPMYQAKVGQ